MHYDSCQFETKLQECHYTVNKVIVLEKPHDFQDSGCHSGFPEGAKISEMFMCKHDRVKEVFKNLIENLGPNEMIVHKIIIYTKFPFLSQLYFHLMSTGTLQNSCAKSKRVHDKCENTRYR